jgi:arylsulfatase A-like enzyme
MDDDDHRLVRAAYWAMVDLVDDAVGRILEALDRTNQRENTLVVFTSDHGEMLGDHGLYLKGPYFYEPAIRVPLVISWPRTVPEGAVDESLVELVDVAPTILDATGVERPSEMQARSLWPRLRDDSVDSDHRESIYCEYYDATDNYEEDLAATMVRTDEYKLVRWHSPTGGELYDLTDDPDETDNRWNDSGYDEVTRDLLSLLTDRMGDTVDPLPERTASW